MKVADYIAYETERQSGTMREALGMYDALLDAAYIDMTDGVLTQDDLCRWAKFINGSDGYRNVPVYFRSGGHAVNHLSIPRAMERLSEALAEGPVFETAYDGYTVGFNIEDVLTKEFLDIHPFADGNGRVGSILWNFLRGTINNPTPMPNFFGND